jgi:hypothetical protein
MPRQLDAGTSAALGAKIVQPIFLVDLPINGEVLHVWSGVGNFAWNGNTYTGVGDLGQVTPAQEGSEVEAQGASLMLSGVNAADVNDALNDLALGGAATIWLGIVNDAGALVGAPVAIFAGLVDAPSVQIGAENSDDGEPGRAAITVPLESRLAVLGSGQQRRYTRADQQLYFPTDTSMNYVEPLNDQALRWGQ